MDEISLGFDGMTLEELVSVSRDGARVLLTEDAKGRIVKARELIEKWVREGETIYGITTGFGALSDVLISEEDTRLLQENVLMSHSAGVGEPLEEEIVRAVLSLRIKDFARGIYSHLGSNDISR